MRVIIVLPQHPPSADHLAALIAALQSRVRMSHVVFVCKTEMMPIYGEVFPGMALQDEDMALGVLPSDVVFYLESAEGQFSCSIDEQGRLVYHLTGTLPRQDQLMQGLRMAEQKGDGAAIDVARNMLFPRSETTNTLFIPVEPLPCALHLKILYQMAKQKFGKSGDVHVGVSQTVRADVDKILTDAKLVDMDAALGEAQYGNWAVAVAENDYNKIAFPFPKESWSTRHIYAATPPPEFNRLYFDQSGIIHPVIENEQSDRHIFAKLASASPRAFLSYFPHGHYSLGTVGLGPTNEFGMRIHENLEKLRERDESHKVIGVFGGSAVWGVSSYYTDCFCYRLEKMLTQEFAEKGIQFSVLNFGLSGQVVLDMMMTYLTFCDPISPDFVISHDGQNDNIHGQMADPHLVNTYRHNYMIQLELWGQKLMDASETPLSQPGLSSGPGQPGFEELRPLNTPSQVIRMYYSRKTQFMELVRAKGVQFIWGLQPAAFGRRHPGALGKQLSKEEQEAHDRIFDVHPFSTELMEGLDHIYKQLTERLPEVLPPEANFINFHQLFAQSEQEKNLFYDHVHLAPEGERFVAEVYFDKIKSLLNGAGGTS